MLRTVANGGELKRKLNWRTPPPPDPMWVLSGIALISDGFLPCNVLKAVAAGIEQSLAADAG